jgi:membrane protein implicated in regulation of membrane protease activity
MTEMMRLDIRFPIGGLFTVLGVLVAGYGIATRGDSALYERSLSVNINLAWGIVMIVFGVFMLGIAWRRLRQERGTPAG